MMLLNIYIKAYDIPKMRYFFSDQAERICSGEILNYVECASAISAC